MKIVNFLTIPIKTPYTHRSIKPEKAKQYAQKTCPQCLLAKRAFPSLASTQQKLRARNAHPHAGEGAFRGAVGHCPPGQGAGLRNDH